MAGARITFDFDAKSFIQNAQALSNAMNSELKPVLLEMTKSFVNVAAQNTPPPGPNNKRVPGSLPVRTLSRKYYTREIEDLKHPKYELSEIDKMQLRAGRRWKVIYDRKGNAIRKRHRRRGIFQI